MDLLSFEAALSGNRFPATVTNVHDGDTVSADITLGVRGIWLRNQPIRLAGCNARELSEPGGPEARDHLAALLPAGTQVILSALKPDNYDRLDAAVTLPDGSDLVTQLIADGWAAPWDGHGPRPVPPWPRPNTAR